MSNESQKDRVDKNHKFELLFRKGIPGSRLIVREYILDDAHIIDAYTNYGCNSPGTKIISILPNITEAMFIYMRMHISTSSKWTPQVLFKRLAGDINTFRIDTTGKLGASSQDSRQDLFTWIPTSGNQFYIDSIVGIITQFKILGYKTGID